MLIRGEISELQLREIRLTDELTESELPKADQDKLEQVRDMIALSDLDLALRLAQELVAKSSAQSYADW